MKKLLVPLVIKEERKEDWTVHIKRQVALKEVSKVTHTQLKEVDKHRHNIREILMHSNGTPLRYIEGRGFTCCFCLTKSFPDPADLKTHTLVNHKVNDKMKFMDKEPIASFIVRLDVTSLKCLLCDEAVEKLEKLTDHLIQDHDKKLYSDIQSRIVPFVFGGDEYTCVACDKTFQSFKVIQEHMYSHYGSILCTICSAPFVTTKAMLAHERRHRKGNFRCPICDKVYDNAVRRNTHVKYVHQGEKNRNKCQYCSEKFSSHAKKLRHEVELHGRKPIVFLCKACDKTFPSRDRLTRHTRKDHLMERHYECQHCEKSFFTRKCLQNHMLKHTGAKEFQCNVCLKSYGRKHTLREHMRIHADDRRFKCELCDQAFVQKCSWKGHMRSKHGKVVV